MSQGHRIHFVGIGGIGMSGIAEVLLNLGYEVSGSDLSRGETTTRLESLGATIGYGHDPAHIDVAVDAVVISSAVKYSNPEVARARDLHIPVIPRAEMLGELMRMKRGIAVAGTHGKTTTTSLLAQVLGDAGLDPTIVIGGKVHSLGTNARRGEGEYLVAEADESDGTFLLLSPTIAVITNIDPEHLEHWGSVEKAEAAFLEFANRVPFYGSAVLGVDNARVAALVPKMRKRFVTFGLSGDAEVRARDLEIDGFETRFVAMRGEETLGEVCVSLPGRHIARNALATIAVSLEVGVEFERIAAGLAAFGGIHRRFEVRGRAGGVTVIDDYGHHPEEVRATLRAAREGFGGRRVVIFQPHRFTRTRDLFEEFLDAFDDADELFLLDIHAAGEEPIEGITARELAAAIAKRGHADVRHIAERETLGRAVAEVAQSGDLVILLGAGDVIREGDGVLDAIRKAAGPELVEGGAR